MTVKITADNFQREIFMSNGKVLVDFYASWCGPCKILAPIMENIAEEYQGEIKVCKVDIDEEPVLTSAFHIESVPTVLAVSEGVIVARKVGYDKKEDIIALFSE